SMKRLLFLTSLLVAAVAIIASQKKHSVVSIASVPAAPMGPGDQEGRNALKAWDLERMRDPATGRIPDDIRSKELAFARHLPTRAVAKSLNWVQQGPINRGGRTRAFRVDATDSNVLIAGSATGGIWRSTDQGVSWTKTSAPLEIQNTSCLGQDIRAGHTQTWYCGTGENYGVVSGTSFEALLPGDGIFKSTDGGLSWSRLPSTVSNDPQVFDRKGAFKHVNSIVVDPLRMDSDIVVAAIFDGIVRSNDGGATWSTVLGLDTSITATSLYTEVRVSSTGVYYAAIGNGATYRGIYRSTDGLTWANIGVGVYPAAAERTVIAIDPNDENRVWFFCESPGVGTRGHSLYKYGYLSGDGTGTGGSLSNRSANLPNGSCTGFYNFDFGYINTQTSYDMCIAVHPTDSNTVFIGGTSVYRSTDGWTQPETYKWVGGYQCDTDDPKNYVWPNHHPDQHWLEFSNGDPSKLYSANDGGVHVTLNPLADSIPWTVLNTGYYTSQFYTVAIEEGNSTSQFIVGGMQDNGSYLCTNTDPLQPWANVLGGDGSYCAIPEGRDFMLMSLQQGKLFKLAVDDAGTVSAFERIDPDITNPSYNFINQYVLDPVSNNKVYWCHASKLYRNNDVAGIPLTGNYYDPNPTNWEQITEVLGSQRLCALDISLAQPTTLFYGTTNGRVYRVDSLDTNPDRSLLASAEFPSASYVSCVAPNDYNAAEWLVTFSNYEVRSVFLTSDSGATWTSVSGNIEQNPDGSGNGPAVYWAMIYPTYDGTNNRYFIGTSTGLYSTAVLDGDNTIWEQEDPTGMGNVPINMITSRGSDGLIVVGTHGSGVFTSHLPAAPIGVVEVTGNLAVGNAWPNPASDVVNIDLYLRDASPVEVNVYDLNGRRVFQRSLGKQASGNSRFSWNLRDANGARIPQGTYLMQATAGSVSRTTKLVVR
ncbi:MAG: T9SS type A sorting domain-containing protein, partial [Flavobacteriales bacterium]|nr:T9SS type A sorting domain-containing protein [Flavobacteriales bacterium]